MNVRSLCLGILSFGEASGYEIKKAVEEGLFSRFIDASFGSIYPALIQIGRPDKKVYAITAAGRSSLIKALLVIPRKDKFKSEFLFQMLLQCSLPHGAIMAAIDKQLSDLNEDMVRITECRARPDADEGTRFVSGYGQAVVGAAIAYLEAQKAEILANPPAIAAE
jgi:PadR family transcriptional regulator, regulatory protein AphA